MVDETKQTWARVALALGVLAAVFTLVVCVLLTATHVQLKKADPLNNATLVALRERYEDGERDVEMKQGIRQLDLLARKAFFTSQAQIRTGGFVAIGGAVVMLLAFGCFQLATRNVPLPGEDTCEGMFWIGIHRSRIWVGGGALVLAAVSLVMVVSTPTALVKESGASSQSSAVGGQGAEVPVLPEAFAQNAPVFRGAGGTGFTAFDDVPTAWDEASGKNVLWKKTLPLPAWASPVVWGDKVVALGANANKR